MHGWTLPAHARRERRALEERGIASWPALAALADGEIHGLAHEAGASVTTLLRLRGQARLIRDLGLRPEEAALLLHAGVPDAASLASRDPQQLWVQAGRLQRRLTGAAVPAPSLAAVRSWIARARQQPPRRHTN